MTNLAQKPHCIWGRLPHCLSASRQTRRLSTGDVFALPLQFYTSFGPSSRLASIPKKNVWPFPFSCCLLRPLCLASCLAGALRVSGGVSLLFARIQRTSRRKQHTHRVTPPVMIDDYLSFVGRMLIAFGLIFKLCPFTVFFWQSPE